MASVDAVPVSEMFAVISPTSFLASVPVNVTVAVPMPAVIVPTAVVTLPVPTFGNASSAASIAAISVALTALHVIGAVVTTLKCQRERAAGDRAAECYCLHFICAGTWRSGVL